METQFFGISTEHHVLPLDSRRIPEVHLGKIPATRGSGHLVLPHPALFDEACKGQQSDPTTDGIVAGAGIVRFQFDQLLAIGKEGVSFGNLAGGCL